MASLSRLHLRRYASPNHRFRGGGGGLDQRANTLAIGERRREAEAFYRRSMMVVDEDEKGRQLNCGVCVRVRMPQLIELARSALLPRASSDQAAQPLQAAPGPSRSSHSANSGSTNRLGHPSRPDQPVSTMPSWLDAHCVALIDEAVREVRQAAFTALADDTVMAEFASMAVGEAVVQSHSMAAEAMAKACTADACKAMAERLGAPSLRSTPHSPSSHELGDSSSGSGGRWYAAAFKALLPRAARATLQLLPLPRLKFDLAAYWSVAAAKAMISDTDVTTLLTQGVLLLPDAFPAGLVRQVGAEASVLVEGGCLLPASTTRTHERACWLLCDEAPPRAPEPEPPGPTPLPPHLFGASHSIAASTSPALCGALRGLRGIAAAVETISELRLATPRGARLVEFGHDGSDPFGPVNSGWPDMGCEICCTLLLGEMSPADMPVAVTATARGVQRKMRASAGALLLTLSRQARCVVPPLASEAKAAGRPRWLTMHMYSTNLRAAADERMLGISKAKREEFVELRNRGMLHGQQAR